MNFQTFCRENPDKRVFLKQNFNGIPLKKWEGWKKVRDCSAAELEEANYRELADNEIVLDIEEKEQLPKVLKWLNSGQYSYEVWHSGSRGYHIHMIFEQLLLDFDKVMEAMLCFQSK